MADLVTAEYVGLLTGVDVNTDADRTDFLITEASALVQERCGTTWTTATVPTVVKQAIAILVAQALLAAVGEGDGGGVVPPNLRAEQIGDYRVEFDPRAPLPGMDIAAVAHLLAPWMARSVYSVQTPVAQDGETVTLVEDQWPPEWSS